jgi:hypothetical protein
MNSNLNFHSIWWVLAVWETVSVALEIAGVFIQIAYDFCIPFGFNTFQNFVTLTFRILTVEDVVVN